MGFKIGDNFEVKGSQKPCERRPHAYPSTVPLPTKWQGLSSRATTRRSAMAISEEARKNHDELFPNHVSTLKETDLKLIA